MREFKPDEESVSRAEVLSSHLMDDLRLVSEEGRRPSEWRWGLFSEQRYHRQSEGIPIKDLLANVSQMATEFAGVRRWHGEIACLRFDDEQWAAISLTEFFGGPSTSWGQEKWSESLDSYFETHGRTGDVWQDVYSRYGEEYEGVVIADFGTVVKSVQKSLNKFLSYRFAGIKSWREWNQGPLGLWGLKKRIFGKRPGRPRAIGLDGGLEVKVSCRTRGLRIHVSPAYFVSWIYFGSPTTPVTGYVLPGRYIFAGDGPMMPRRRIDPTIFCIPADYYPTLTRF